MKTTLLTSAMLLAAACGGSSPATPDGGGGAVTVTKVTPADGATKVSAYAPITIELSGAADATSITTDTVQVHYGDTRLPVAGAVSYDDAKHTITFTPSQRLSEALSDGWTPLGFRVDVKGVTAGGVAVTPATSHFHTYVGPRKSEIAYANGTEQASLAWEDDAAGNITGYARYDAGPDGKLGTADDTIMHYRTYTRTGRDLAIVTFGDPGADGKWHTADDVITDWVDVTYNAVGEFQQELWYDDPGTDGKWQTADDHVAQYDQQSYDDLDRVVKVVFGDPGADGVIGNSDDNIASPYIMKYSGSNVVPTESINYLDAGVDGVWFTADDTVQYDHVVTLDAAGAVTSSIDKGPGADGKLGTADDDQFGLGVITLDAHHAPTMEIDYDNAGTDNQWGTADDNAAAIYKVTYDGNGTMTESDRYTAGTDLKPNTADDVLNDASSFDGAN